MTETAFFPKGSSLPKSSELNKDVWIGTDPSELIQGGYAQPIDFAPRQAQSAVEAETRSQSIDDRKEIAPTAFVFHDGIVVQLRTPDPAPETRSWVTMHPLQEWEGYILSKGAKDFVARLRDLTAEASTSEANKLTDEEAIIPLSEIADDDFNRIQPGSVFRWVIGYERAASGTKRRISQIVFRDLPSITDQDKSEGVEWARTIMQSLKE